jgi:uncharacterized protein
MKPVIDFITLAVKDLKRSFDFYQKGMGFPTKGIQPGHSDHALFDLDNGFGLVLYKKEEFAKATAAPEQPVSSSGFMLSHIASSKTEVDEIIARALKAGAKQIGQTKDEPWGYAANFADPDGHQWEITFMPGYDQR